MEEKEEFNLAVELTIAVKTLDQAVEVAEQFARTSVALAERGLYAHMSVMAVEDDEED